MGPVTRSLTNPKITVSQSEISDLDSRVEEFTTKTRFFDRRWYGNDLYRKALYTQIISKMHYPLKIEVPLCFYIKWGQMAGLGDFMFGIKTALMLRKHFPSSKILLHGVSIPQAWLGYLRRNKLLDCFADPNHIKWKGDVSKETLFFCLQVAIPTKTDHFAQWSKIYTIDEYNGWRSNELVASNVWRTAGLGVAHNASPAVGIHINDSQKIANQKIDSLHNKQLRDELNAIWAEEPDSSLFFGYNSSGDRHILYRFIASVALARDADKPYVFVIVEANDDREIMKGQLYYLFKKIDQVCMLKYKDHIEGYDEYAERRQSHAYPVTIIFSSCLDPDDMKLMNNLSEGPTLMSGDQSFAEIASMKNKILFYQEQPWKKELIEQFKDIASILFGGRSPLVKFLNLSLEIPDQLNKEIPFKKYVEEEKKIYKRLASVLKNTYLQIQFDGLFEYIRDNYNIEHWLIGDIKKQIIHQKNERLKGLEEALYDSEYPIKDRMKRTMASTLNEMQKRTQPRKIKGRARKKQKTK